MPKTLSCSWSRIEVEIPPDVLKLKDQGRWRVEEGGRFCEGLAADCGLRTVDCDTKPRGKCRSAYLLHSAILHNNLLPVTKLLVVLLW